MQLIARFIKQVGGSQDAGELLKYFTCSAYNIEFQA